MKRLGEKILWMRARDYVRRHKPLLIGVTGSFGKTITKEAIALALKDTRQVRAAPETYNTPVGVALSILGVRSAQDKKGWIRLLAGSRIKETVVEPEPDTIVLELGADRPGDIDYFASRLPFKIGVVTGVGSAHLQYFVEKDNIAHEKMSLVVSLPRDGTAVLNIDDPYVQKMADHVKANLVWFGKSEDADVQLVRAERSGIKGFAIEVDIDGKRYEGSIPYIAGRHQLSSVLAALAITYVIDPPDKEGAGGSVRQALNNLQDLKPPPGRLRVLEGRDGSTILDDSYNAPPEAVVRALTTLAAVPGRRKIAVLGDMLELGAHAIKWHTDVGAMVAEVADIFVAVGPQMKHAQAAALESEREVDTHHFEDSRDVGKWLGDYLQEGDVVLIKGSRDMHMEEVVKRLLANPEKDSDQLVF